MNRYATLTKIFFILTLTSVMTLGGCGGAVPNAPNLPTVNWKHVKTNEVNWPTDPNFQNCWNDLSKRFGTSIHWEMPAGTLYSCEADGTYLPVNDERDMVLMVLIPRTDTNKPPVQRISGNGIARARPAMRLAITSLVESSNDREERIAVLPQVYGNPPIECDLNAAQAEWVQQNGVPQTLVDAMRKVAKDAEWQPIAPNSSGLVGAKIIIIDPSPHFPK